MPYRKNYRKKRGKRNMRRRGKRWGRRPRKYRVSRWGISKYNIHKFRRMGRSSNLALAANLGSVAKAFNFNFAEIVNNTEFTNLYDQYRIDFVTVSIAWSPKTTIALAPNNLAQPLYPIIYYCKDYDDNAVPTSLTSFKEKGNLRHFRLLPNRIHKIHVKPAVQKMLINQIGVPGAAITFADVSTGPVWNKKVDCNNPTLPHLGLKMMCEYVNATSALGGLNFEVMYHFTCFGVR